MSDPNLRARIGLILIILCSFSLYMMTLAPTVQGFDSAELTMGAYDLGFVHPTGYPLYLLTGHLFAKLPISNIGYRLNLTSAIFASIGAGMLYLLALKQTRNLLASLSAAALFASMPINWSQAIRAEVYSLHVCLMICALLSWFIACRENSLPNYILAYIFLGLGLANHLTSALLWASMLVSALWLDRRLRTATIPAALLGLLVAGAFYTYFPWRSQAELEIDYIRPYFDIEPGSLGGILWMISGQTFSCLLAPTREMGGILRELLILIGDLFRGTLGIGLALSVPGWLALSRTARPWNRLLSLYFILNVITYLVYGAVDKEVMFIPLYVVVCIWFASGIHSISRWLTTAGWQISPGHINQLLNLAILVLILFGIIADLPGISLREDRRAYEFAQQVLTQVAKDTIVVNHWATASVFDYIRLIEGRRPDVQSFNADFYFLGIQEDCDPISNQQLLELGWIDWLLELTARNQLCYVEPLHGLPEGYRWRNHGLCWNLVEENVKP